MVLPMLYLRSEKKNLEEEVLQFKVLFITHNKFDHCEFGCYESENVDLKFLSPNKITLLYPLDQDIIHLVNSTHTFLVCDQQLRQTPICT
jgi:hypothetical protein